MKYLIILWVWLFLPWSAHGQVAKDYLFIKDHITISLTNTWSMSKEVPVAGQGASLGLRPDVGGRLGLVYSLNLGKRVGLETGSYLGVQSIGYRVQVDNRENFPFNNFRFRDACAYVEIPFRLFGRFRLTDKVYSYNYLGAHVTRFRDYQGGFGISDTLGNRVAEFQYLTNVNFGMYLFWDIGSGVLFQLGNGDMVRLNLMWHKSADGSDLASGNYSYLDPQSYQPLKSGRWSWRGGYIGIELGYVFTRMRELERNLNHGVN